MPVNTKSKTLLLIVSLTVSSLSGKETSEFEFPINGLSSSVINLEYPWRSTGICSRVFQNHLDKFPFNHSLELYKSAEKEAVIRKDSLLRAELFYSSYSETGEALFNRAKNADKPFHNPSGIFEMSIYSPGIPLVIYGGQQSLNSYSDRFESLWNSYSNSTGNSIYGRDQAICNEYEGGYIFSGSKYRLAGNLNRYHFWGSSPFLFSPVFTTGYKIEQKGELYLDNKRYSGFISFDKHSDYLDYQSAWRYEDWQWSLSSSKNINGGLQQEVSIDYNSRISPPASASAGLYDTLGHRFRWELQTSVFSNSRLSGGIKTEVGLNRNINTGFDAYWHYRPEERDYFFPSGGIFVVYNSEPHEMLTAHVHISYIDTLIFPVSLSLWHNYLNKPLWEHVEYGQDTITIKQSTYGISSENSLGLKGDYTISIKNFKADLWGNIILAFNKEKNRFHIPYLWGTDLFYEYGKNGWSQTGINLESRGPFFLRYYNLTGNELQEINTEAFLAVSFFCRLSFHSPFFRENISPILDFNAGPFNLGKKDRIKRHPRGTLMGPKIKLSLDCKINKR